MDTAHKVRLCRSTRADVQCRVCVCVWGGGDPQTNDNGSSVAYSNAREREKGWRCTNLHHLGDQNLPLPLAALPGLGVQVVHDTCTRPVTKRHKGKLAAMQCLKGAPTRADRHSDYRGTGP